MRLRPVRFGIRQWNGGRMRCRVANAHCWRFTVYRISRLERSMRLNELCAWFCFGRKSEKNNRFEWEIDIFFVIFTKRPADWLVIRLGLLGSGEIQYMLARSHPMQQSLQVLRFSNKLVRCRSPHVHLHRNRNRFLFSSPVYRGPFWKLQSFSYWWILRQQSDNQQNGTVNRFFPFSLLRWWVKRPLVSGTQRTQTQERCENLSVMREEANPPVEVTCNAAVAVAAAAKLIFNKMRNKSFEVVHSLADLATWMISVFV